MPNFLRSQTFPYAGSSTGPYRGLMARKYPCWDAQGPARDLFTGEIAGKIKACLEQCLPESNSFVGFSLFMVGKLPEKTKPTIMIVSDDKSCRKAAFQIVKSKNMLTAYPGFELGHCSVAAEFEDLRQLGSGTTSSPSSVESNDFDGDLPSLDDLFEPGAEVRSLLSAEVCAFEPLNYKEPTRLYFHMSQKSHSHTSAAATCGGLIIFEQRPYALTMAHAIDPIRRAIVSPEPHSDPSSQSDDFEITGMDDWDEGDEEDTKTLTAITSPGSKTPSELSDSEESLLRPYDSHLSSEIDIRTQTATGPSVIYEEDYIDDRDDAEDEIFELEVCERIGSVVSVDEVLDIAVIKVTQNGPNSSVSNFINGHLLIELLTTDSPTKTSITIKTTHHAEIRGQRSEMPF
ncbi:hypothetical protein NUW58_g1955 [Xylaria curta]|uniref:Uncharacterized protein n=1 Tax=Xylaria curta TaxID=42375 RepID=A0ACC1PIV9_9PEZI|nr:hypothetical protein NUW58_g1955 [Xylaria curta]